MDVGTRSSTPRRLREDLRTTRGDTERTAANLIMTNQGNRTFHVVSERLTKRFFSFFQAVYSVQETSVHFMVLHGFRTLVVPIPSPLQPPDPAGSIGRAASQHAMPKQKLTDASRRVPARSAARPDPDRLLVHLVAGFGVRVSPGGASRSWCGTASEDATGA